MSVLLLLAKLPVMRFADPPTRPKGRRVSSLDGLRGFLAFAVFFHHAAISHVYLQTGKWEPPPSRFYDLSGQFGVSTFFMITAYLFWAKLLKEKGKPDWTELYLGRVFRIGPVYWFAVCWMLLLVFINTGFQLHEPLLQVFREAIKWLTLGLFWPHDVNQYTETNHIVAGVTWSLQYEWFFYFSLVLTAVLIRRRIDDLALTATALTAVSLYAALHTHVSIATSPAVCCELFLIGMTCASLQQRTWLLKLHPWLSSGLTLLLVTTLFFRRSTTVEAGPALLLGCAFFLIISGCNLFGLLTSTPARRLGNISYGIYLLQGLILTCLLSVPSIRLFSLSTPLAHWLTVTFAAVCLVVASLLVHIYIERPGIELGRNTILALRPRREFQAGSSP